MPDFAVKTAFTATDKISPAFKRMGRNADMFGNKASRGFARADKGSSKFMSSLKSFAPAIGVGTVIAGFNKIIDSARMIEDAKAAFTPLIGGVEKAEKLVNKLNITAANTPFQFDTLAKSAQQLLPVMKGDIDNTIKTIKMLGDTAGGNAQKLDSITRGYTKAMLKGKVDMESLNMIAEAGVPIFTEMAKSMGFGEKEMSKFFKQISSGKVPTSEMVKVFEKMTGKGGIFFEGMIIASKTTSGVISTMKDNVTLLAAEIGTQLLPYVKQFALGVIDAAKGVVQWIKANKGVIGVFVSFIGKLVKLLPFVAAGFIAYKIALVSVAAWQGAILALGWLKYLWMMRSFITAATIKQWLWNAALTANPIGLVIAAIAALIAIGVVLYRNWDLVKKKFFEWTKIFDNPIFATVAAVFAPFIAIPVLIARNWDYVVESLYSFGAAAIDVFGSVGSFIISALLFPMNLVISAVVMLLNLASNLPLVGDTFKTLAQTVGGVQSKVNAAVGATNPLAPNQGGGQNVNLQGEININNAPAGSSASSKTRGANPIPMNMVGEAS